MAKTPEKRGPGRPKVGATPILARLRSDEIAILDRIIKADGRDLSRPEALRALVQAGTVKALRDAVL